MRYQMKQKLFSWGNDFTITNANGEDAYFVDGKAFALGNQLSFQDMQGNELAYIRQKLLAWGPTYELTHAGQLVAVIKKHLFTFLHCVFTVDEPGSADLTAEGDLLNHEYSFTRAGRQVASVSKAWFTIADSYGVDVADGEDPVLILASTVVIDLACDGGRNR